MSITNNNNYKAFTKSPPASLLNCIKNIEKCRDFMTMAALSFTKSTGLC